MNPEERRLLEVRDSKEPWKKWGPYLSERQWGTVREDYSENGNAWDYFSKSRSVVRIQMNALCIPFSIERV